MTAVGITTATTTKIKSTTTTVETITTAKNTTANITITTPMMTITTTDITASPTTTTVRASPQLLQTTVATTPVKYDYFEDMKTIIAEPPK